MAKGSSRRKVVPSSGAPGDASLPPGNSSFVNLVNPPAINASDAPDPVAPAGSGTPGDGSLADPLNSVGSLTTPLLPPATGTVDAAIVSSLVLQQNEIASLRASMELARGKLEAGRLSLERDQILFEAAKTDSAHRLVLDETAEHLRVATARSSGSGVPPFNTLGVTPSTPPFVPSVASSTGNADPTDASARRAADLDRRTAELDARLRFESTELN